MRRNERQMQIDKSEDMHRRRGNTSDVGLPVGLSVTLPDWPSIGPENWQSWPGRSHILHPVTIVEGGR